MTNYQTFKELVESIVNENPKSYSRELRKNKEVLNWLHQTFNFTNYLPEMVYALLHPDKSPFCNNGNKRKFRTITEGWNRCNTNGCSACILESKNKAIATNIARYGYENPMQDAAVKKKNKLAFIKNNNNNYEEVVEKRKKTCLKKYGVDHNWKTKEGQEKRLTTIKEKYGVDNPSNSSELQEKKRQTFIKNFGVSHPMKSIDFKNKIVDIYLEKFGVSNPSKLPEVRKKASKTMLERYGVDYASQNQFFKDKAKDTLIRNHGDDYQSIICERSVQARRIAFYNNISNRVDNLVIPNFFNFEYLGVDQVYSWICNACNTEFKDDLDDGSIPRCPTCFPRIKSQGEEDISNYIISLGFDIIRNSRSIIPPLELDIFIPTLNFAIEFNGVYFHSELSGKKDRNYHLNKYIQCKKQNIELIQIYDFEWIFKTDLIKSRIRQKLGLSQKIYGRNCTIKPITSAEANTFVDKYHLQGRCNSKINYGLFYNNELISVMTFSRSRYNRTVEYELIRFCSKSDVIIVGGASKLLKMFEKDYNHPSIVSYCDIRYNNGGVYSKIGFNLSSTSKPNYWYHKNNGILESRIKYQKHKLKKVLPVFNSDLSEWENMKNNGYDRIWDCGNMVYIKNI